MIRAVLDSNIIVSGITALERSDTPPARIIRRALSEEFRPVVSEAIMVAVRRAFLTKRYLVTRVSAPVRERLFADIEALSDLVAPETIIHGIAPHWHDDAILATVAASGADWFVTGDRDLLAMRKYAGVPFTDPAGFLGILDTDA